MPITFRYDAAAVVPPSNQTTRKYGQNLVLQQQQQKYAAQQAGYDRMLQLGRDAEQNKRQAIMQGQQNAFQTIRDVNQNASALERQEAQNKFLTGQAAAEDQRRFMEDARKQSSGMIMDDIKNGNYDPVAANKLRQNLIAESEALGNQNIDATQRAEALAKIRAERTLLTTQRMETKPPPTAQELHDQSRVIENGVPGQRNAKGEFVPFPQQPKPATSAAEAFKADPKIKAKHTEDAIKILTANDRPLSRGLLKEADDLAAKLWEDANSPTEPNQQWGGSGIQASTMPPPQPSIPGTERSILEQTPVAPQAAAQAQPDDLMSRLDATRAQEQQGTSSGAQPAPAGIPGIPPDVSAKVDAFVAGGPTPDQPTPGFEAAQKQLENNSMQVPGTSSGKPHAAPDFSSLAASAKTDADRGELQSMKDIYNGLKPEAKQAMNVILSDSATTEQKAAANRALLQMGINLQVELSKRAIVPEAEFPSAMM